MVISGFLFKEERFSLYLKKSLKRLIIPYVIFVLLSLFYYLLPDKHISLSTLVTRVFFLEGRTIWNAPLWYLPAMFLGGVFFRAVYGVFYGQLGNLSIAILGIFSFAVAILFDQLGVTWFFLGLNKAILFTGYMCVGFLLKHILTKISTPPRHASRISILSVVLFAIFGALAIAVNWRNNISVMSCDYNNIFFYIPISIILSISFILAFYALKPSSLARLFASNTIFIMASHYILRYVWLQYVPTKFLLTLAGGLAAILVYLILLSLLSMAASKQGLSKSHWYNYLGLFFFP